MGLFDFLKGFFGSDSDPPEDPSQPAEEVVSKADFAQLLMDRASEAGVGELLYDPEQFCIRGPDSQVSFLHNRYAEFVTMDEEDRDPALDMWTGILLPQAGTIPEDWAEAAPRILPRIRSRAVTSATPLQMAVQGMDLPPMASSPLCEHLVITPVYDTPTSMASISETKLTEWGVSLEQVLLQANHNLRATEAPIAVASIGGLKAIEVGDSYDSSRMLLPEFVARLELEGDPVALPLSRSHLLFAGSRDPEGLQAMLDLSEGLLDEPRLATAHPVVFRQGRWETWFPHPDLPSHNAWQLRIRWNLLREYTLQKDALEPWQEQRGIDVFVASYKLYDTEDGAKGVAILPPVPTLMPRADEVLVVGPDEASRVMLSWAEFRDRAGEALVIQPELWPPRFRIEGPPNPALWQALVQGKEIQAD